MVDQQEGPLSRDQHASFTSSEIAQMINGMIDHGDPLSITQLSSLLTQIPRPIVVDFNEVLVDKRATRPNPDAANFLSQLGKLGTIVVVTLATDWQTIKYSLKEFSLWHEDMILLSYEQWGNIDCGYDDRPQEATDLISHYIESARGNGLITQDEERDLLNSGGIFKRVAPLFNKPWLVPMIDDTYLATNKNPGMLGIRVYPYNGTSQNQQEANAVTFPKAVEILRDHFQNLPPGS